MKQVSSEVTSPHRAKITTNGLAIQSKERVYVVDNEASSDVMVYLLYQKKKEDHPAARKTSVFRQQRVLRH